MKIDTLVYGAATVLCSAWLLCPGSSHAARRNFNLSINGKAESCAQVEVSSKDGEVAKVVESLTLTRAEASQLEMNGGERGNIHVRGWDRPDYSVETCKLAVAENTASADRMARAISVTHSGGRISFSGPASSDDGQWQVVFFVHAPRSASVDLETKNGPIEVRDLNGSVKVRAINGPVAVSDCTGTVEAHTTNGPIAFAGDRGDVHLNAQNGPIALKLQGESWNGSQLEARTINGPLAVTLPDNFRTGMRLETSGNAPLACSAALCRNAFTDAGRNNRVLQMNGASDTIRLSTENGPVAIHSTDGKQKERRF